MAAGADQTQDISHLVATAFIYLESVNRRSLSAMEPCLTTAQYHALVAIEAEPGGALGSLAERMLCDKANASGIVDRLAAMHLVDRRRDPSDRRRVTLNLTERGQEALAEATQRRTEALDRVLRVLDADAVSDTISRLNSLVSALASSVEQQESLSHMRRMDHAS